MVKVPEKSPDWKSIFYKNPKIINFVQKQEIEKLVEKANEHYYYWDKIRFQPIPKGYKKEEIWSLIRLKRNMKSNPVPVTDINEKNFFFWLNDSIQKNLHLIDQNMLGLIFNEGPHDEKMTKKYTIASLIEEAITSSQIEGAVATIKDAKKMLLEAKRPKNRSEQMIYNNYLTMQSIKEICKKDLSLQLLLDLHVCITKDTLETKEEEGCFRTTGDDVNVVSSYGEVLFTPPSAEEVQQRLNALIKFANSQKDQPFIHPIIKAIILHFWMAYIHPFTDGNGRMARTLFYWYMLRHGYDIFEYTSISKIILKRTTQYANAYLYSEYDDNDLTYFIHFHMKVIMDAFAELKEHIQKEKEKNLLAKSEMIHFPLLNLRQTRIIQHVMSHPHDILTIKIHQNVNQIAYQTARTDLLDLAEKGWLKYIQKGNKFYFVPTEKFWEKI